MSEYIREHSVGTIVKSTFAIYFRNFIPIIATWFLPVFLFAILQVIAIYEKANVLLIISMVMGILAGQFAYGAITLLISDICLGNKASVLRYYRQIFGPLLWRLLATNLLQLLILGLCLVPALTGVIGILVSAVVFVGVMLRIMFCNIAVVLERVWGMAAIKRSAELSKGKVWRNLGTLLAIMGCLMVVGGVIGGLISMVGLTQPGTLGWDIVFTLLQQILMPISLVAAVLLYYDLRARKEAFNLNALAEDLRY